MRKLLLVEDSALLKIAMKRLLAEAGFCVVDTANGDEVLQLARNTQPDLIILDMMLPGVGGEVVLRRLKRDPEVASIPVLVVSSLCQGNADKLKDEGAIAYIEKSKLDLKHSDNLVRLVTAALRKGTGHAAVLAGKN